MLAFAYYYSIGKTLLQAIGRTFRVKDRLPARQFGAWHGLAIFDADSDGASAGLASMTAGRFQAARLKGIDYYIRDFLLFVTADPWQSCRTVL